MTSDFEWASPKRLKLLLAQIRGLSLDTAIIQMSFSAKHQAQRVREVLESLRLKAVNTYQKDPVNLFVGMAIYSCIPRPVLHRALSFRLCRRDKRPIAKANRY